MIPTKLLSPFATIAILASLPLATGQNPSTNGTCNDIRFEYEFTPDQCELRVTLLGNGEFCFASPLWSRARCDTVGFYEIGSVASVARRNGSHQVDHCDNGQHQGAETCRFAHFEPTYKQVTTNATYGGERFDGRGVRTLRFSNSWDGLTIRYVVDNAGASPVTVDWQGLPNGPIHVPAGSSRTLTALSSHTPDVLGTKAEVRRSGASGLETLTVPTLVPVTSSVWATRGSGCNALAGPRSLRRRPSGRFALGTTSTLEVHASAPNPGASFLQLGSQSTWQDLAALGLLHCDLLMSNDFGSIGPVPFDSSGVGRFPIAIPNRLDLVGARLHVQGLVFSPVSGEISLSNAGLIGVGF